MKKVITSERIPIKMWLDTIEDGALNQARNLANLPFAFKHVAIMPDSHQGYGMPIGGVLPTKDIVIPNAVGVDIGCGMYAIKLNIKDISYNTLESITNEIKYSIPLGFKHHKEPQQDWLSIEDIELIRSSRHSIVCHEYNNSLRQLGTLGGGNHFIEIQKGSDEHIWVMIHSGSRNLGYKVAQYYNAIAKAQNNLWFSSVSVKDDLAFLPLHSEYGLEYMNEMRLCISFAKLNRFFMMNKVLDIIDKVNGKVNVLRDIDIAHNYADIENHFGHNVVVHRKGATRARLGEFGIIPGSQGTSSYIVKGLGNPESFMSCSHGAGRLMSRKKAKENLNLENEIKLMNDKNIIHSIESKDNLDEASGAYKNIDEVMWNQRDLVEIDVKLEPLAVVKG